MALVAIVCSLFLAAVGALGVVAPLKFVAAIRGLQTRAGLYFAAVFRIVLGAALFLSAPASRVPELLLVIGTVSVVAGVATPFFGLERFRKLLDRVAARGPALVRAWAALALGLGLFLAFAVSPGAA